MVTIKGGVLKGGTTRKKKRYMEDRKPVGDGAQGRKLKENKKKAETKNPKKLEGALTTPKAKKKTGPTNTPKAKPTGPTNVPKAAPKLQQPVFRGPIMHRPKAKPSTGSMQVKQKPRELSTIEKATKAWKNTMPKVQGSDNSRFGYGPYPKNKKKR